jgi:hypothetical protein
MPPLLLGVIAIVAALLLFSGLLLLGVAVVRRLRLPTDLPDGPRFEAPPPALVLDPAGATERAAAQAAWSRLGARARARWQQAVAAHEARDPQAAALEAEARQAEAAFRAQDEAALARAEAAMDALRHAPR